MDTVPRSLWRVLKLCWEIKKAVDTDRQNKKDYRDIVRYVDRVGCILWCLRSAEVMKHSAMSSPLDDLADSLDEALNHILGCQERKIIIVRLCVAGRTAKKLCRVKKDIEGKVLLAIFAATAQIISLTAPTILEPPQMQDCQYTQISVVVISVELGCYRCYRRIQATLRWMYAEGISITMVNFDQSSNEVILKGPFSLPYVSRVLIRKASKVVKGIRIMDEPVDGTDMTEPPPLAEETGTHPAHSQHPPREDDVGRHSSKEPEGREASVTLPEGVRGPTGLAPQYCTETQAASIQGLMGRPLVAATCSCRSIDEIAPGRRVEKALNMVGALMICLILLFLLSTGLTLRLIYIYDYI